MLCQAVSEVTRQNPHRLLLAGGGNFTPSPHTVGNPLGPTFPTGVAARREAKNRKPESGTDVSVHQLGRTIIYNTKEIYVKRRRTDFMKMGARISKNTRPAVGNPLGPTILDGSSRCRTEQ